MGIFDESYSPVELSRILGVHRVTVAKWIKAGALKAVRTPGGRFKVSKDSLREFLHERGMPVPAALRFGDKKLVVAVDGDPSTLKLLQDMFSREELSLFYSLKIFSNPMEAALFIGDAKPDIVLLDLMMPQLDGFLLAGQLNKICPKTRVIVITGHFSEKAGAELMPCGVKAVVEKPFTREELIGALQTVS